MKYNMRNIFLEESYTKYGGEASPKSFYKKIKTDHISEWIVWNVIPFVFIIAWKVSKYRVFSGPYFPIFSPNMGKHGPGKTQYLDTFHTVYV